MNTWKKIVRSMHKLSVPAAGQAVFDTLPKEGRKVAVPVSNGVTARNGLLG